MKTFVFNLHAPRTTQAGVPGATELDMYGMQTTQSEMFQLANDRDDKSPPTVPAMAVHLSSAMRIPQDITERISGTQARYNFERSAQLTCYI